MRRLLFILFATAILGSLHAGAQPLVILDQYELSGFLSLSGSYASILEQPGYSLGAGAAIVVDRSTVVGLEAAALFAGVKHPASADGVQQDLELVHGGLLLERIVRPEASFHPVMRALLGIGQLRFRFPGEPALSDAAAERRGSSSQWQTFLLFEPGIGVEHSVARATRIELSGRYRFTSDVDIGSLDRQMLRGPIISITIKAGAF
jgi:hypothetical protein